MPGSPCMASPTTLLNGFAFAPTGGVLGGNLLAGRLAPDRRAVCDRDRRDGHWEWVRPGCW